VTVSTSREPARIAGMFDAIAWRYDRLNHLLSLGLDRRWRRRGVRALELTGTERILDVCTGTGDLAIEAIKRPRESFWAKTTPEVVISGAREVLGIDFAGEMLRHALDKVRRGGYADRIRLARGDATCLPVPDAAFDAAMVAFGIRNVADPAAALREMHRVLRPGGRLMILEFGFPRIPGIRAAYKAYFRHVLPRVGRAVSRHGEAYSYLPASVADFGSDAAVKGLIGHAGFTAVRSVPLTFGIVYLYCAGKPV
jgi:demethylmenaquinone methyltransferase/2-methoxy-6-polyprenyl-1,4-benzoquinol methylase